VPLFNHIVQAFPKLTTTKIGVKKLETSLYRMVNRYFDILNHLGVVHECDRRTDGQTDSTAFSNSGV